MQSNKTNREKITNLFYLSRNVFISFVIFYSVFYPQVIFSNSHCVGSILSEQVIAYKKQENYKKLIELNGGKESFEDVINESDNIHFVENFFENKKEAKVVTVENYLLKQLNDSNNPLLDKSEIDRLNDIYRRILYQKVHENGELAKKIIGKHYGYKDMKFAFDPQKFSTKDLDALKQIYEESAREFATVIEGAGLKDAIELFPKGYAHDLEKWFAAGVGDSIDESAFYARLARDNFTEGGSGFIKSLSDVKFNLKNFTDSIETNRKTIMEKFKDFPEMVKRVEVAPGVYRDVPSSDVFEILRKVKASNKEEYIEEVTKALHLRFGENLSPEEFTKIINPDDIISLRDYFQKTNIFSPPVVTGKRVELGVNKTVGEVLSFDISGLGARNAEGVCEALAKATYNSTLPGTSPGSKELTLKNVLKEVRLADDLVTKDLENLRGIIKKDIDKVFGKDVKGISDDLLTFTGDDGIFKVLSGIKDSIIEKMVVKHGKEKGERLGLERYENTFQELIVRLSNTLKENNKSQKIFRITRSNKNSLDSMSFEKLIVTQELLEKNLRKKLVGKISSNEQNNLMLLFSGLPAEKNIDGQIRTVISVRIDIQEIEKLSPQSREIVKKEIQKLAETNKEIVIEENAIHFRKK